MEPLAPDGHSQGGERSIGSETHEAAFRKDRGYLPEARWKPYHPVSVQVRNSRAAQLHHKSTRSSAILHPLGTASLCGDNQQDEARTLLSGVHAALQLKGGRQRVLGGD